MKIITEIEQETSDIDWFFTNGEDVAFVASGGGKLPLSVSESAEKNSVLSDYFSSLPFISKVIFNPDLEKFIGEVIPEYLEHFTEMSKRGLCSYDKTALNNFSDTNYHLVAIPITSLKLNQIPVEISSLLMETRLLGNIKETIDIRLIP